MKLSKYVGHSERERERGGGGGEREINSRARGEREREREGGGEGGTIIDKKTDIKHTSSLSSSLITRKSILILSIQSIMLKRLTRRSKETPKPTGSSQLDRMQQTQVNI